MNHVHCGLCKAIKIRLKYRHGDEVKIVAVCAWCDFLNPYLGEAKPVG